ncbi:MAG: M28 family peptidase [Bryobacteraceae bacterium]|nr:M28 family peptidase [Bryobacteraceae bacterium]
MPLLLALAFDGASAYRFAREAVDLGPRPPGSAAIVKLQAQIAAKLRSYGCEVTEQAFTAQTPAGPVGMKNILCRLKGTPGARALAVSGHYDTKPMPGTNFVGANDAGSSTGFLLELARVSAKIPRKKDLWIVFFDGEEAFAQWTATDSLYGSRHLAKEWASSGFLARVEALINVDMIGDKDLNLLRDANSSPELVKLVWSVARELGYAKHFEESVTAIEDDHMPFRRMGVAAIDLIDFEYGPLNRYWHTDRDTMDKLAPESFALVGKVVVETLRRLDAK